MIKLKNNLIYTTDWCYSSSIPLVIVCGIGLKAEAIQALLGPFSPLFPQGIAPFAKAFKD
jgi:hypothetical protein